MDDVIEHTVPSEFLSARDATFLTDLCRDFLQEKDIATDAFAFAVQIITPAGPDYES